MHEAGHSHRGVAHLHPQEPPFASSHAPVERIRLLYQQGPWVEVGEYQYYLQQLINDGLSGQMPPHVVPLFTMDLELQELLVAWANRCVLQLGTVNTLATALLIHDHWFPVILRQHAMGITVVTTPEAVEWIEIAFQAHQQTMQIKVTPLPWSHQCDCGFRIPEHRVDLAPIASSPGRRCAARSEASD